MLNKQNEIKHDTVSRNKMYANQIANYNKVEAAIFRDPVAKQEWLDLVNNKRRFPLPQDLIGRHEFLTKEYLLQTRSLFEQYGIDTTSYTNDIKLLEETVHRLHQEKVRKK